jgi:hypothetical protein
MFTARRLRSLQVTLQIPVWLVAGAGREHSHGTVTNRPASARASRARPQAWRLATQSKEPAVADKSPRQSSSKKPGKSIKEKRADKRAAASGTAHLTIPPHHPSK